MKFGKAMSVVAVALALVACEKTEASPAATKATADTSPPSTVPKATTTTEEESTTTSSSTSSTTTTIAPDPVMPLTGQPITDPAVAARPAVVVKVSNDPGARPQSGLDAADIVFEAWGAGPTRFASVFQSTDAPKVGPIRSART